MAPRALLLLALLCSACVSRTPEPQQRAAGPRSASVAPGPSSVQLPSSMAPVAGRAQDPTLLITDRDVLSALEQRGLSLSALLGGPAGASNLELSELPRMRPLFAELQRELQLAAAADPAAGVDVARSSHRLFDRRFLRLPQARFELVGVVNRPDRAPFHASSCGETRLVYRLRYELDAQRSSKLPMTLGIELRVPRPDGGCAQAAARWLENATDPASRAEQLRSTRGPLAPDLTRLEHEDARVVVNLQLVRWPSTVRPDLGGHAEYLLRSFRPAADGVLAPEGLENTPAPAALSTPARQQELSRWLARQAHDIDEGTALLPASFLAQRALSVTPRGLNRLSNRPFTASVAPSVLAGFDFSGSKRVRTVPALLRRLDQLSCQGCHEARSVAGFHLLGEDPADAAPENALAVPVSAQVSEDLPRRLRVARQMLDGVEPSFDAPLAERAGGGGYGAHCSLGTDASFADWSCEPGLRCSAIEATAGAAIGQCLPLEAEVGDACEAGGVVQHADRRRDRMGPIRLQSCGGMVCNRSAVGFPGGMCTGSCGDAGATCGAIAVLDSFNACLARGEPFLSCIRANTRPAGLRSCDAARPCRDDYVCARGSDGGVCLPPYFVFQLRVDGHSSQLRQATRSAAQYP